MDDARNRLPFLPARAKLWIGSLDVPTLEVCAQYNPKELQIDKQITWQGHKPQDNRSGPPRQERSAQDDLEYNGGTTRIMTVELLFDRYESGRSRDGSRIDLRPLEKDIGDLEAMSAVRDPEAPAWQTELRRPHHCVVAWGDSRSGMRPFRCVIESLAVKYTMWDTHGIPLRATCTLKLKEATKMSARGPAEYGAREHASWSQHRDVLDRAHHALLGPPGAAARVEASARVLGRSSGPRRPK